MASPAAGSGAVADDGSEDYSPEVTVVRFDPPLPLLRAPVPSSCAGPGGEAPVLAFRDAASWKAAWEAAEASLVAQCEAGARSGCSITASRKCKPPWWKGLFGSPPTDYQERERCEEREMASCLEAAKEACSKFAKEKCIAPFRDARIASEGLLENSDLIVLDSGKTSSAPLSILNYQHATNDVTNYKGSDLLDSLLSKDNEEETQEQEPEDPDFDGNFEDMLGGFPQANWCDCCGKVVWEGQEPQNWTVEWVPSSPTQDE